MPIRVILCEVGQAARVAEIESGYETFNQLVGGYIECVGIDHGVMMICNEEGAINGMPLNRLVPARAPELPEIPGGWDVIITPPNAAKPGELGYHHVHGNFFFCRVDHKTGEEIGLTDEDIARLMPLVVKPILP